MKKNLKNIPVDSIKPNPDNPRIIFRQEELDNLMISIKKFGVQVPIVVYQDRTKFYLIDGERRWRTSMKLNLKTIPAIIQSKPSILENLLMMFNIHSLREQWDYFTIANKLTTVIDLLAKNNKKQPNEAELSEETGLTRGTIRRCKMLIDLPDRFKSMILEELKKPKSKQKYTEDFFLEMESALRTVGNNLPEALPDKEKVRDVLIEKYGNGTIKNMVDFRKVAKISTSPNNVGFDESEAKEALGDIFSKNKKSIDEIYNTTVSHLYDEKKLIANFSHALTYIKRLTPSEKKDQEIREMLFEIKRAIDEIL